MKVRDLIKVLCKCDEDMDIYFQVQDDASDDCHIILGRITGYEIDDGIFLTNE